MVLLITRRIWKSCLGFNRTMFSWLNFRTGSLCNENQWGFSRAITGRIVSVIFLFQHKGNSWPRYFETLGYLTPKPGYPILFKSETVTESILKSGTSYNRETMDSFSQVYSRFDLCEWTASLSFPECFAAVLPKGE